MTTKITRAARFALEAHNTHLGLETDNGSRTDVWHLIASLLEYSDQENLDFDEILADVRGHFAADVGR